MFDPIKEKIKSQFGKECFTFLFEKNTNVLIMIITVLLPIVGAAFYSGQFCKYNISIDIIDNPIIFMIKIVGLVFLGLLLLINLFMAKLSFESKESFKKFFFTYLKANFCVSFLIVIILAIFFPMDILNLNNISPNTVSKIIGILLGIMTVPFVPFVFLGIKKGINLIFTGKKAIIPKELKSKEKQSKILNNWLYDVMDTVVVASFWYIALIIIVFFIGYYSIANYKKICPIIIDSESKQLYAIKYHDSSKVIFSKCYIDQKRNIIYIENKNTIKNNLDFTYEIREFEKYKLVNKLPK